MFITVILPLLSLYIYQLLSIWSCDERMGAHRCFLWNSGFLTLTSYWLSLAFFPGRPWTLHRVILVSAEQKEVIAKAVFAFSKQSNTQKHVLLIPRSSLFKERELHEVSSQVHSRGGPYSPHQPISSLPKPRCTTPTPLLVR